MPNSWAIWSVFNLDTILFKIYGDFENPLFLAKDVSEWIEHNNITNMMSIVDEEEKLMETLFTSGQNRQMWFLTEDGLYEVLMQSRKPIAKQFKKQVKVILKEIRKTGSYSVDSNNNFIAQEIKFFKLSQFKLS